MNNESDNGIYLWIIFGILGSLLTLVIQLVIGNIEIKGSFVFKPEILISLVAIIIAFVNTNEIKKQRIKMYEPTLILEESEWKSSEIGEPYLKMRNIGYGSAVNVHISWDYSSIINGNTKYVKNFNQDFVVFSTKNGDKILNKKGDENVEIEFVLPVSIEKQYSKVPIPQICILQLKSEFEELAETAIKNKTGFTFKQDGSAYAFLDIKYRDINDEEKTEKYKVSITPYLYINNVVNFSFSARKII